MVTRRQFTAGAGAMAAAAALGRAGIAPSYARALGEAAPIPEGKTVAARLVAAERPTALECFGGRTLPIWTFGDGAWPAVLRFNLGDRLEASLENKLPRPDEITSIHWHGIRLRNNQDGVPYLVQPPVRLGFAFHASDIGRLVAAPDDGAYGPLGEICTNSRTFWTINDRAWPERDHSRLPPPLAVLERGRSYILQLKNSSEFSRPIHIHGHTFKLLRSNKQNRPVHHTDTLLLLPEERAEVALVADNPGDWMFHCLTIEHQETGMMGYIRVV